MALPFFAALIAALIAALAASPVGLGMADTVLQCNHTLLSGSTLTLTKKLDLSGRGSAPSVPWPCGIYGPRSLPPATIVLPSTDCVLHSQGLVTLSGNLRFLVGDKADPKGFDCCGDGEAHGSILCSDSNMTVLAGAVVTVETKTPNVEVNPGGFWTGGFIHIDGTVNASLRPGQMTGDNGLLSSTGVRLSSTARVVVSGQKIASGAAVQGGDDGTVLNGTVACSSYVAGGSGGCVAGGKYLAVGPTGTIRAFDASCAVAGCAVSGSDMVTFPFRGRLEVQNMSCDDAGAIMCADNLAMAGESSIIARDINSIGGPAIAMGNLTLSDTSQIVVTDCWGGDGGAIGVGFAKVRDNAAVRCTNTYGDNCGGCILAHMEFAGNASVVTRNATGGSLGGALCGGYPGQTLTVRDTATIDVTGSNSRIYGGAIMAHNVTFGPGAFAVRVRNATAQCGAAIATLGWNSSWGQGFVTVDGIDGGTLLVEDVYEGVPGLGCDSIYAHLQSPPDPNQAPWGPVISQPCSACAAGPPFFPPARQQACTCAFQKRATVRECCSSFP